MEVLQVSVTNAEDDTVTYSLTVIGTLDGETIYDSQTPEIQYTAGKMQYYSCTVLGIWHTLKFTASAIGDRFHVKSVKGQLAYAGKLS